MLKVKNIFVEKRNGFRNETLALDKDIEEMLKIRVESRIVHLYLLKGLSDEEISKVEYTVFGDPSSDIIFHDRDFLKDTSGFILELLPGQYDQRAQAAEDCIKLVLDRYDIEVRYKTVYLFPQVTPENLQRIQDYLLNPVEMRAGSLDDGFESFPLKDMTVEILHGFRSFDDYALITFLKERSLAMNLEDLKLIRSFFIRENRDPSITEVRVLDTYWSDHCRHTTFLTHLSDIRIEDEDTEVLKAYRSYLDIRKELGRENRPVTLMDLATIGTKYLKSTGHVQDIDESEEINACSIERRIRTSEGEKDVLLMFKNETHNHPTEIEPYGGAATCLGGAIRDPLSGRAYVYQGMRITGAGDPRKSLEETLAGKLPQRAITKGAAKGFSSYGNQIGLNTGFVEEIYHPGYEAKRMETGAVIASALKENVRREVPEKDDMIILLGGRTGRDGIGGATGSSKGHSISSIKDSGAEVQKGNAVEERKLQRFFRNEKVSKLIRRCNDFGAGGVSVAIGELAESIDIYLDLVPKKYMGLDPTEIAISESQERMAVVIDRNDLHALIAYAEEENLEATMVAKVTDTGKLRMFYEDQLVVDLSRAFIDTNGAASEMSASVEPVMSKQRLPQKEITLSSIKEEVQKLQNASQKGLLENFDSTIGRSSLILPFGGKYQDTKSQGMVSLVPLKNLETYDASVMTYGFDPYIVEENPFRGANDAVVESLAKLVSLGADPKGARLSFQEYFRKLGEDSRNWGRPLSALLGALKAQLDYKVPAIGGKDSMSGSFNDLHVPNTLISFAVTTMKKEDVISNVLKGNESILITLITPRENGLYVPEIFMKNAEFILMLRDQKLISACDTLKKGLFSTIFNMAAGNRIGFSLEELTETMNRKDPGSFVFEIPKEHLESVMKLGHHLYLKIAGETTDDGLVTLKHEAISLEELLALHKKPLSGVFNEYRQKGELVDTKIISHRGQPFEGYIEHPKVLIPVFFGTNCEYDLEYAFRKEGADVNTFIFQNEDKKIRKSLESLSKRIRETDILMLSGGFSAADEPEGSGKYIANVLRNSMVKDAVHDLLDRGGLILGICNGFQGLVKSGLLPYGRIIDPHESMPTLTYNTSGKHMSRMARTKVVSLNTPWMQGASLNDIHDVPVSHGEGRFLASKEMLEELSITGQIITQYADPDGNITMEGPYNPNGSMFAIEGISSPDGRIFGKMGHTERYQNGLYVNYEGCYYKDMFKNGVNYFRNSRQQTE